MLCTEPKAGGVVVVCGAPKAGVDVTPAPKLGVPVLPKADGAVDNGAPKAGPEDV